MAILKPSPTVLREFGGMLVCDALKTSYPIAPGEDRVGICLSSFVLKVEEILMSGCCWDGW